MQSDSRCQIDNNNVINLFTGKSIESQSSRALIQLCAETNGTRMLYSSPNRPERLIAVPILCWGLRADGEVVGLVPWINEITDCTAIDEQLDANWEGYYQAESDTIFYHAPDIIVAQLATAMRFNEQYTLDLSEPASADHIPVFINRDSSDDSAECDDRCQAAEALLEQNSSSETQCKYTNELAIELEDIPIVQEIPDLIGTHALLVNDESHTLTLTPVVSWVLDEDGELHGMLVDEDAVEKTPVVPGDDCLYVASSSENFRCYFQRDIAEQIRVRNPETMAAIEKLLST